jgi:pyrroloquinoline quinone biosynthesis protein D
MNKATLWRPRLHQKTRVRLDPITGKEMLLLPEAALILNETAAAVVRMCDGSHSAVDMVEEISAHYRSYTRDNIAEDVSEFLDHLQKRGLLK